MFAFLTLLILFSGVILTGFCNDILSKAKFSTFGYDLEKGTNKSCSKEFFNSSNDDDCRIYYTNKTDGKCGDFFNEESRNEESEDLNGEANLFIRKFNVEKYTGFKYVGLNVSFSLLNNDTQGYAIKLHVPASNYQRCQVYFIHTPKPRKKAKLWNDQYWFNSEDFDRNFTIQVIEYPSRKQFTFYGKVTSEAVLASETEATWEPVIFVQALANTILVMFSSAPFATDYSVKLIKGNQVVQKETVPMKGLFNKLNKVYFHGITDNTSYIIKVKGNCDKCITSEFLFETTAKDKSLESATVAIVASLIIIFLITILTVVMWSKFEIKPKVRVQVLIIQSYDCEVYSAFVLAFVKALSACPFEVLVDKYRNRSNVIEWIPVAVTQSDFVLILWSEGAASKDNRQIELREPGNTVSAQWNYALTQVKMKLNKFDFKIANVFCDKTLNHNQIDKAFNGFEEIFLTNDPKKGWKKLISFLYSKNIPLWKRRICKLYREDLRNFEEGKKLLEAHSNLKSYKLDIISPPGNENFIEENEDDFEPQPLVVLAESQNNDSGFDQQFNSVESQQSNVSTVPKNPPTMSWEEARDKIEKIEKNRRLNSLQSQPNSGNSAGSSFQLPPSNSGSWNQPMSMNSSGPVDWNHSTPSSSAGFVQGTSVPGCAQPVLMPPQIYQYPGAGQMPNIMPVPVMFMPVPVAAYPVPFNQTFNQNVQNTVENASIPSTSTQSTSIDIVSTDNETAV